MPGQCCESGRTQSAYLLGSNGSTAAGALAGLQVSAVDAILWIGGGEGQEEQPADQVLLYEAEQRRRELIFRVVAGATVLAAVVLTLVVMAVWRRVSRVAARHATSPWQLLRMVVARPLRHAWRLVHGLVDPRRWRRRLRRRRERTVSGSTWAEQESKAREAWAKSLLKAAESWVPLRGRKSGVARDGGAVTPLTRRILQAANADWRTQPLKGDLLEPGSSPAQLTALLMRLEFELPHFTALFDRYAVAGGAVAEIRLDGWCAFQREEQGCTNVDAARASFLAATGSADEGLGRLQFCQLLLAPSNSASDPAVLGARDGSAPLCHYWIASSHNSYLVGHQLTGYADESWFRRQLLQGARSLEIDCWDGPRDRHGHGQPVVTHGNTLVNRISFAAVARAIAETAFVVSKAPVLLSLEMHCSEKQQARLHELLHQHLGRRLVRASEVEVAAEAMLTLQALQGRVLVQAKLPSQGRASTAFQAAYFTSACRASARASSARPRTPDARLFTPDRSPRLRALVGRDSTAGRDSFVDEEETQMVDDAALSKARRGRPSGVRRVTEARLQRDVSMLKTPIAHFLAEGPVGGGAVGGGAGGGAAYRSQTARMQVTPPSLQVTSISETRLLALTAGTEAARAREVAAMQRRTAERHARGYPAALRIASDNADPLSQWALGVQQVCAVPPTALHPVLSGGPDPTRHARPPSAPP